MPNQTHYDIAQILHLKGVEDIVMSPGSRCAPLTISMVRHPKLKTYTFSDERSAAFIALGMAESRSKPIALICTSGTAVLNYYPAITEAFYRGIPLIVITADRPPELIDQWDGQTIRQSQVFKNHIVDSIDLPVNLALDKNIIFARRSINEIINKSISTPGPVHINVPLREPLYPAKNEKITFSKDLPIISDNNPVNFHFGATELKKEMNSFKRMMILVGQMPINKELNRLLAQISKDEDAVIIGDHISNLHPKESFICNHDLFLKRKRAEKLPKPDLLISLGRSILSKSLKKYLRNQDNLVHWQVGFYGAHDTYSKLQKTIQVPELRFIQSVQSFFESDIKFVKKWKEQDHQCKVSRDSKLEGFEFSEISVVSEIIKKLPKNINLHLSNSLSTRYVNLFQDLIHEGNEVFCNRGTSGIDGCSSTVVGHALSNQKKQLLITGDLAFFYDRNAFWHNYNLKNLRIVLLNNHGGGIFRVIDGPDKQPELDEYFDTRQNLNALNSAKDFAMDYNKIINFEELSTILKTFYDNSESAKIIEIETQKNLNERHFKQILSD
ncbi:MAG: 2-succinyl-5-enolpyruvyl-6-hydroxy-3-cyclohexene-1-carboxylic-acid synthase [Cytophagales bacterium]